MSSIITAFGEFVVGGNMVIGIIVDVMSKKSSSGQLSADENQ